jgi:phosphoribosylanthranilate isomerase
MGSNLFIKICGITNLPDALCAIKAGANALGFIFHPRSPRFCDVEKARHIIRELPRGVVKVGVFVDEPIDLLLQYLSNLTLDYAQLHGNESPEFCSKMPIGVIKGLRVRSLEDIKKLPDYPVAYYLLDSYSEKSHGGTGAAFDWSIALEAKKILSSPILLAGGLTPENVAEAVRKVEPYGVDVSSGVETSPGIKDHKKIGEFIINARNARTESEQNH